jgi:putative transport protein
LRVDLAAEVVSADDAPGVGSRIEARTVLVDRELPEMSVGFLRERLGLRVAFGRMRRDGQVAVVTDAVVLHQGDRVSLVGEPAALDEAAARLGTVVDEHLELDRSIVDFRRIVVSSSSVAQRPLRELHLDERFGAVVTRLRRGDVELVPTDDTHLELGDAVRVVAPREQLPAVSRFLGDSHRALAEIDVISFSLGIGLGLVLGQLPIPLPGGGTFSLGFAGGPLVAGLVLGRIGRTGRLVWTLPYAASLTLRQVGLVLFLAGVGTRSGWAFAQALRDGHVLPVLGLGVLVTTVIALTVLLLGHKLLKIPAGLAVGMVAGIQTQPADLAFAIERTRNEVPSAGYAAVYPVATVMKIVLAQLLLRA